MKRVNLISLLKSLNVNGGDMAVFLLSLLLAFTIWLAHNLSQQYSSLVSVPVVAVSNIDGRASESSNTVSVVARCRTSGYTLISKNREASHKQFRVFFSPEDLHHEEGEMFSISNNELSGYVNEIFGDNVLLESFVSSSVQFRFPEENHKTVPVQAINVLSYKPQYMSSSPLVMAPDSVVIYGEPLQLEKIDRVYTETITLQNLSSAAHGVVRLDVPRGTRLSETEASYSLDVTRYVEVSASVPVSTRNVPAGKELDVYPSVVDVVFRCSFPLGYDPIQGVHFYIDYRDFTKSINGRCIPKVEGISSGVIDYRIEPQVFECIEKGVR